MKNIDLGKLSRKELLQLRTDIEKALVSAEKRDRANALAAAERAAAAHGFGLAELIGMPRKTGRTAKSPARYQNPADSTETWTGRGRPPRWFREALARGIEPEKMQITNVVELKKRKSA